jgi:adenosine deaminase
LHRHLEGSLRFSTVVDFAHQDKIDLPKNQNEIREFFLIETPMMNLGLALRKFVVTQQLLSTTERLRRITFEVIEDAFLDGIKVLEIRYSPTFILDNHPLLSWEKIHAAITDGVKQAQSKYSIAVGLIGTVQRIKPVPEAEKVIDFFIEHKNDFIGVDLADDEDGFQPEPFSNFFLKAKKNGLGITIHAGEIKKPSAPLNVISSIEKLGATRIGHGIQIINSLTALELVLKNNIHLEVCPTSNYLTQSVEQIENHPIQQLISKGVSLSINSDDPGIFGYTLSSEYELCHKKLGLSLQDIDKLNQEALKKSFIPTDVIRKYWPMPSESL